MCAGDTSGDGSDWNTGYLTDNTTGKDVATLRVNFDEDLYARQMFCLGRYYNDALMAIEVNFSTHPQKELERLGYSRFYVREQTPDSITGRPVMKYGFKTTTATRPLMLSMLRQLMREQPEKVLDMDTLSEMSVFVKNEKGKPEAMNGEHDDMVIARAINCYAASQQTRDIDYAHMEIPQGLPKDVIEDMENDPDAWKYFMSQLTKGDDDNQSNEEGEEHGN